MAQFFINRPIFAWVLAIVIMLAGGLSIFTLPLEQYPDIAPPRVSISTIYTGASAETVENSVTQVIEQQLKGIDNLLYMGSSSDASGSSRTTLTFTPGTNIDVAQVQVQNKLQAAMSRLPEAVQSRGVFVTKGGNDYLTTYSFTSPDPHVSQVDIGDYIASNLVDVIGRIDGVGDVTVFGTGYAMRIWMNPALLEKFALMPSDIVAALKNQNAQVSAGQLGALPATPGQQINASITARTKLKTAKEFQNILLKVAPDGAAVLLQDVARVELGADNLNITSRLNGKPGAGMGIVLADGANATTVADAVNAKLAQMQPFFPNDLKPFISSDSTPFVRASIKEVVYALAEAILLVVLVMFLFLQNFRATLIPAIAVPVVLLGTMGVLSIAGYSINTLTMFALVLAIGLLVDDAIVVVENVERVMSEQGLSPKEATRKSMAEITPALIGIALTLTPALCASLLKPIAKGTSHAHGALPRRGLFGVSDRFFLGFNRQFDRNSARYQNMVGRLLRRSTRMLVVFLLICGGTAFLFSKLPTSFLPVEDQGYMQIQISLPPGGTNARLQVVMKEVQAYFAQQSDVVSFNSITGLSGDQASARGFLRLKDWSQRLRPEQQADAIARKATEDLKVLRDARIFVMLPPAVRGLGSNAGFNFQLKDLNGQGHDALVAARDRVLELAKGHPMLRSLRSTNLDDTSQLGVTIDDRKAAALGVSTSDINSVLSSAIGGSYVNDFLNSGRVKRVYVQGDAPYRMLPQDIGQWTVRNAQGNMVPFSAFSATSWTYGSPQLQRYNGSPSYEFVGDAAPGVSSGAAMDAIETILRQMPPGIGYEWTGASFQERLSGAQAPLLYAVSILFVFLCLAALYESWTVPLAVILAVPLGVIGALAFTGLRGLSNDVYFQVGLLTTVGLASKNAILIVEFATQLQERGRSVFDATLEAVRLRLRPILMTSLAFGFGVLPLALGTGAGAGGRHAIGTAVLGGVVFSTVLGIFFVPIFFLVVRSWFSSRGRSDDESHGNDESATLSKGTA